MRITRNSERCSRRHGMIVVQVAVTLIALLAVSAIALDVGILLAEKRHAQAVADAAALAGAIDLYTHYINYNGNDTNGTAAASALAIAAANGYSNDGTTSIITVNIPPQSGYFVAQPGYVEVIAQYNQPRGFSNLFGSGAIPVKARAVARGAWRVPKGGILVLDPTASEALSNQGGGLLTVNNGVVIVDSNNTSTNGALKNGGGGNMSAQAFNVTGSVTLTNNSTISTTPTTGVPATPDSLSYLTAPSPPAPGTITYDKTTNTYILTPGSFGGSGHPKLPNFQQGATVIFKQASYGNGGIYYLTAGGFASNGANLIMDSNTSGGMMFYNAGTGSSDSLSISGNSTGTVSLGGLTSGLYQGILYFQARGATEPVSITGNGNFSMEGTIYTPSGSLKITGNGASSVIGSNLIADTLTISGNGNITVDYSGYVQPKGRFLGLVE
jgi:Flp pilus assembly protein TadG